MKIILKIMMGLCIGMSTASFVAQAAETVSAVVSQAPSESGRIRIAMNAPQGEPPREMDVALIPPSGDEKTAMQNDFQVGDKVVVAFEQNEATGMYETSLTKLEAAGEPQKEQK